MIKNRYKIIILISFILFGFGLNSILISLNDFEPIDYYEDNNKELINPKLATALKYSDILQNATTIYRLFESINFTIDTIKPNVTWVNQTPINITSNNIYTSKLNITYNISDINNSLYI